MKKLFTVLIMAFVVNLLGQQTVLFHENFDFPSGADSVSTGSLSGTNPPLWSTTTTLATSPTQSYKVTGSMISRVYFETQSFSTVGVNAVYLSFNQIAKVSFLNNCKIHISTNNGSTWSQLTGAHYYGSAPDFSLMTSFNEASYYANNNLWGLQATGSAAIPQASWWITEDFDITNLAIPTSGPGYTQVKLRFEADFVGQLPSGFAAGWFVDDVKIIGAQCELRKPDISFSSGSPMFCQDSLMTGGYNFSPTFNRTLFFNVTDNAQLDSVRAVEIINGGAPRYSQRFSTTSGIRQYHNFTGYNPKDTVRWAVEAYDMCGNLGRFPDTGYYMFYFADLPQKCLGGECDAVHQMIDTFPWKEDFESSGWVPGHGLGGSSGRGSMPNDQFYNVNPPIMNAFGWSVFSGPSTSSATGASGDNTSGTGNYLYTDFTGQAGMVSTSFMLPCIDLRDSISRTLSFYYHMFGSDVERLKIDIDTTPGAVEVWFPYLKLIGEKQTTNSDPWKKATISLEPFRGKIVKLRFYGQTIAGSSSLADIAIDDIEIMDAVQNDLALLSILSPDNEPCSPSAAVPVSINVLNNGINTLTKIPVAYQLGNLPVVYDTIKNISLKLGDTTAFTYGLPLSYSPAVSHNLKVWVALPGDSDLSSDTLTVVISPKSAVINSFPHFQNFENASTSFNGNGNLNSSLWTLNTTTNNSNTRWVIREGIQNNNLKDLTRSFGRKGKHVTLKMDSLFVGDFTRLQSSCIDLQGLNNPILHFQAFVPHTSYLEVQIKEEGQTWTTVFSHNNNQLTLQKTPMEGWVVDLSNYIGKVIQIAFKGINQGRPQGEIVSIDDITIKERSTRDLSLRSIDIKTANTGIDTVARAYVLYSDFGVINTTQTYTVKLRAEFTDQCNPTTQVITASSDSYVVTAYNVVNRGIYLHNLSFSQPLPQGNYSAKYWLESAADQFTNNDTLYSELMVIGEATLPYFNDFESCNGDIYLNGSNNQWEITSPRKTGFTQAKMGLKCAVTNADTMIFQMSPDLEILQTPNFSGLDSLYGVELRFWQKFDFGTNTNQFGIVQINDKGWQVLDNKSPANQNWNSLINRTFNATYNRGFTGASSGWVYSIYPLTLHRSAGAKAIRFVTYNAHGTPGWALDDLQIYYPPQNSGSPKLMSFLGASPRIGKNNLAIEIRNSGAAPLTKIGITIEANGTILHQETKVLGNAIPAGKSQLVNLSLPVNLNAGMSELLIHTTLPNNRKDAIPTDDTLKMLLKYLPEVISLPKCFGFETSSSFLDIDTKTGSLDTLWKYGIPNKKQINSAHAGSNTWFTKDSLYASSLDQHLYTPIYPVNGNFCYRFSFWQNFDTERNFDGGNVEFTLDSGLTWQTLGRYWSTDSLWYNTQFIQSLDYVKPGFSGNSGGWVLAQNDFKVFANSGIQFRFRFASNANISGEGWAIDDVCLESIGSNCSTIGFEPNDAVLNNAYLYPVPASSLLNLRADINGVHQLSIYDQRGALIRKWTSELNPVEATTISIENLSAGVYWLQIENTTEPIILKFIKE